jgi:hypothetical protein
VRRGREELGRGLLFGRRTRGGVDHRLDTGECLGQTLSPPENRAA